jgi:hypothetical protein
MDQDPGGPKTLLQGKPSALHRTLKQRKIFFYTFLFQRVRIGNRGCNFNDVFYLLQRAADGLGCCGEPPAVGSTACCVLFLLLCLPLLLINLFSFL